MIRCTKVANRVVTMKLLKFLIKHVELVVSPEI